MHEQLDELLAARDQMELLLQVIVEIGSDLDLDATLRRIIRAARDLTSAPYGALAVRDPDGMLISFFHAGIDDDTARRIGSLPVGKGVLSLSLFDTPALRLDDVAQHPAAVGFPEHHPTMQAFLGVPITIRGKIFGNLYLTHDEPGRLFSESDEVAARALAFAAAVAIDNAQIFERERAAVKWMDASREITTALLSSVEPSLSPLQLIAERACALTEAEQAIVLVPGDADLPADEIETLVVSAAVGLHASEVIGQRIPVDASTTGGVFLSGKPLITEALNYPIQAFTDVGQRSAIVMPLRTDDEVVGVIAVARGAGQPPFDDRYLELVSDFATHAAIALMLASGREHARRLTIVAERERIAHDLHDHVIQRLFAAGMDLQGTVARARSPEVVDRLNRTLDDLQTIIEEIRTTIFRLKSTSENDGGFRHRIQRVVTDLTENRDIVTTVRMHGPTTAIGGELAEHAEAVTAEAVSNAVRHSGASRLTVAVSVADMLTLDIIDNGCGMPADNPRRSGLANMLYRAEQVGGRCEISRPPEGGTRVQWTAPLTDH
ncbi:GAF domain-containing sensor histidine kinase [Mycobacterium palustre]|uniref:Histidine kinase n=1 Tax=Mycobacterium palustre TaxID=153971 RepID=A0A1X1ZR29_9MYCO|nr:GAF domain-containing protein [Mycobacterium palustre]MCV7099004.1 GAF domain-containing sensor histidine kinase [Mycobacterium palustre]ORW25807.1 histidine kinase [Mycobacterium palustre]